jgi:hypothetical protein
MDRLPGPPGPGRRVGRRGHHPHRLARRLVIVFALRGPGVAIGWQGRRLPLSRRFALLVALGPGRSLLTHLSVHDLVDDLCKKAASLWIGRGKLGIAAAARAHAMAATWENNIYTLCIKDERALSTWHAVMTGKDAQHLPEIYPVVMQAHDSERSRKPETAEPIPARAWRRGGGRTHRGQTSVR